MKVDAKTKTLLDEYKSKKDDDDDKDTDKPAEASTSKEKNETDSDNKDKDKDEKENGSDSADKEEVDEMSQREDRVARAGLEAIMREYAMELNKPGISGTAFHRISVTTVVTSLRHFTELASPQ